MFFGYGRLSGSIGRWWFTRRMVDTTSTMRICTGIVCNHKSTRTRTIPVTIDIAVVVVRCYCYHYHCHCHYGGKNLWRKKITVRSIATGTTGISTTQNRYWYAFTAISPTLTIIYCSDIQADTITNRTDQHHISYTYKFDEALLRLKSLLIAPWAREGMQHRPQKRNLTADHGKAERVFCPKKMETSGWLWFSSLKTWEVSPT